jgi:hypothetical protein
MANVAVVTTMPKQDFANETRLVVETVGHLACDPAVAAEGSGLLLLSDDLGLRLWSALSFQITSTWLQPVLMIARKEGLLSEDRYFEAINTLALGGHTYTSLEPGSLLYQAQKDGFELTDNLGQLLDLVGGPAADVVTNCGVIAKFLSLAMGEHADSFRITRISSRIFESMTMDRRGDQRLIVALIMKGIPSGEGWIGRQTSRKGWLGSQALAWLIGHSIGLPDFGELVALQKS